MIEWSGMNSISGLRKICLLTAGLSLILVALGAFVRATGAGLACPDWPLCFGKLVPEFVHPGVVQEYLHRVLASVVALLVGVLVVRGYQLRTTIPRFFKFALIVFGLVLVQAILGGLTVIYQLNPFIVTSHLALGTIFFQLVALVAIERRTLEVVARAPRTLLRSIIALLIFGVFAQIVLGGFVGSSGASLSCADIPFCRGEILPADATGAELVQTGHRLLGIALLLLSISAIIVARRTDGISRAQRGHLIGMTFTILLQIGLGVLNVVLRIPVFVTLLHLVVAQVILLGFASFYRDVFLRVQVFTIEIAGVTGNNISTGRNRNEGERRAA